MNSFTKTLTIFSEKDVEPVAMRLADCQIYSEKIAEQLISTSMTQVKNNKLNIFQVLDLLKERKGIKVSFYCIAENKNFYIFSDFFNINGAYSDTFSFFDDLDTVIMMCNKEEELVYVDFISSGKGLVSFCVNGLDKETEKWKQDYEKMCIKNKKLPNPDIVEETLNFIMQISHKTEKQMNKYLREKSCFIDEYII